MECRPVVLDEQARRTVVRVDESRGDPVRGRDGLCERRIIEDELGDACVLEDGAEQAGHHNVEQRAGDEEEPDRAIIPAVHVVPAIVARHLFEAEAEHAVGVQQHHEMAEYIEES